MQRLTRPHNPVVFFDNGIGDHILSLPALRALASEFNNRLTLVCNNQFGHNLFSELEGCRLVPVDAAVRRDNPDVAPTIRVVNNTCWMEGGERAFDVAAAVRQINACDLFISPVPYVSDSIRNLRNHFSEAPSLGFFEGFTHRLIIRPQMHSSDIVFLAAKWVNPRLDILDFSSPMAIAEDAQTKADCVRNLLGPAQRVLAVHVETVPQKMWDLCHFAWVLGEFLERNPQFVVWIMGRGWYTVPMQEHADRVVEMFGLPLELSFALVSRADLFFGVDSCMLHAADSFRVPGLGLFGPTRSEEFGFRYSEHIHVQADVSMDELDRAEVLTILLELAARNRY